MRLLTFTGVGTIPFTYRAYKYAGIVNLGCVHAGKSKRNCVPRDIYIFNDFLSFLEFDMESRGCWVWSLIIFYSTGILDPNSKWGGNAARKIIAAVGGPGPPKLKTAVKLPCKSIVISSQSGPFIRRMI